MDTSRHDPTILATNVYETLQSIFTVQSYPEKSRQEQHKLANRALLEFINESVRVESLDRLCSTRHAEWPKDPDDEKSDFQPMRLIKGYAYGLDNAPYTSPRLGQEEALQGSGLFDFVSMGNPRDGLQGIVPKSKEIGDILKMLIKDRRDDPVAQYAGHPSAELVSPEEAKKLIAEYAVKRGAEMKQAALFAPDKTVTGLHLRTRAALALQAFVAGRG